MKTAIAFFAIVLGFSGDAIAQQVRNGMSLSQVKALFPDKAKMFYDTNQFVALDTFNNFYFYGVKGEASFIFQFGQLKEFRWVYTNGKEPFTELTKIDSEKIQRVLRGIVNDYGRPQTQPSPGNLYWATPHAVVGCSYSPRDFRFSVFDSALRKLLFPHAKKSQDSTVRRH